MHDHSPTVRRAQILDGNNTRNGGSTRPALTLPPVMVARIALEVARMDAEAKKIEQRRLQSEARPWQPRPLIVNHRKAWWWEAFLIIGAAIFTAEACTKVLTGHWIGR